MTHSVLSPLEYRNMCLKPFLLLLLSCVHIASSSVQEETVVDDCKDRYVTECEKWQARGDCEANPDFMATFCAKTCGSCPPISKISDCEDLHRSCKAWGARGECSRRPAYMNVRCPLTCRTCPPTEPGECIDQHEFCFIGSLLGECANNPSFYLVFCAHSCRSYKPGCLSDTSSVGDLCENPHFECGNRHAAAQEIISRRRRSVLDSSSKLNMTNYYNDDTYQIVVAVVRELGGNSSIVDEFFENINLEYVEKRLSKTQYFNNPYHKALTKAKTVKEKVKILRNILGYYNFIPGNPHLHRHRRFLDQLYPIFQEVNNICNGFSGRLRAKFNTGVGRTIIGGPFLVNWCGLIIAVITFIHIFPKLITQPKVAQPKLQTLPTLPFEFVNPHIVQQPDFIEDEIPYQVVDIKWDDYHETAPIKSEEPRPNLSLIAEEIPYQYVDIELDDYHETAHIKSEEPRPKLSLRAEEIKRIIHLGIDNIPEQINSYKIEEKPKAVYRKTKTPPKSYAKIPASSEKTKPIYRKTQDPSKTYTNQHAPPNLVYSDSEAPSNTDTEPQAPPESYVPAEPLTVEDRERTLVPFCTTQGYLDLVKRLKRLIGRNNGRPLTILVVNLAFAINFCQYGIGSSGVFSSLPSPPSILQIKTTDIALDGFVSRQPPKNWPGISFTGLENFKNSTSNIGSSPPHPDSQKSFACGGAPITPYHILTSAHCVIRHMSSEPSIWLGSVKHSIQEVTSHPDYSFPEKYNDLAIITLNQKIMFTESLHPFCLPNKHRQLNGKVCEVSGWGQIPGEESSKIIHDMKVRLVDALECEANYTKENLPLFSIMYPKGFTDPIICAGRLNEVCRGDSGGPLVLEGPDSLLEQVGVVSTGYGCGNARLPGIYTRVDKYLDWIMKVTMGGC